MSRRSLLLLLIAAACLRADGDFLVEGVIVDSRSHQPLARATVTLTPSRLPGDKLDQVTPSDGGFHFHVTQPGKYSLRVGKPGYPNQAYKGIDVLGVSSAIVVRDGQDTRHIVFEAVRGGAIDGVIRDEDGEPVGRALVQLLQAVVLQGERKVLARSQTRADASGEFRFSNLQPATYYLCAMGRPWFADEVISLQQVQGLQTMIGDGVHPGGKQPENPLVYSPDPNVRGTAFQTTCYPNAQTVEEASGIHVEAGAGAQIAVKLPLARAVKVSGTITVPGGSVNQGRVALLKKLYDARMTFVAEPVAQNGAFELSNVPPGSYEIVAASLAGSAASNWSIVQDLEVGPSDLDVHLKPSAMGSLSGTASLEAGASLPAGLVVLIQDLKGRSMAAPLNSDGSFSLSPVPAGTYELKVQSMGVTPGAGDVVATYIRDSSGARLPLHIEIKPGAALPADLGLARAGGMVEGVVEHDGAPQIGATVLLVPSDPSQRWAYRLDQTDSDGSYQLAAVLEGDYFAIAFYGGEKIPYREAGITPLLIKAAKRIHVGPGEHVDLKLDVTSTAGLHLPN